MLFADLKGSMELLADHDPEEARKLLDPVLERMMGAVHHYEGTVNQVMGDGIMALFGAPVAHEDHAVRACYAALRMQESVRGYADAVSADDGVPIQIRVGLNSGEVSPAIGSDLHRIHRGRLDDVPGGPLGADGHAGVDPDVSRTPGPGRGLRADQAARPAARQRAGGAGRDLRAHWREPSSVAPAGLGHSRADEVRGPQVEISS